MTTEIAIAWWLFLVLALPVTLVDVYLLARVVRRCRNVRFLSQQAMVGATGIVNNTTGAPQALTKTVELVGLLGHRTPQVGAHVTALRLRLSGTGR